jgi:hypothetical protein
MKDYINKMFEELPPDMDGRATTPAANYLFAVDPTSKPLCEEIADMFYHYTAKLLFLSKRARPDIQTAVAFLTMRVKGPDDDDYKKLVRVVKYLRDTADLLLTLEADNLHVIKWWIDGSFGTHDNMKSHTGGTMSMGYSTSTTQKINMKSSTEAELVAVSECMPQVLWTRYFLEAQGYDVRESIIYQDNMSAEVLEKNGRRSSGKRTRHINIRYFFVADRVKAGEVSIEHCPTDIMRGDFLTKPLQGKQFREQRADLMNIHD